MIRIITFLILFLNLTVYSQDSKVREDSLINNIELELNKKGISDYFTYRVIDESFMYFEEETRKTGWYENYRTYIFWSSKEGNFVKKINPKNIYREVKIEDNKIFDFLNKNIAKIKTEKVKSYQEKSDGKLMNIDSSDPYYVLFNFKTNGVLTTKTIRTFDLENNANYPNCNYEFNSKLNLIILNNMCRELTTKLESEKVFTN
nr:hypothetical protein [uncultured Flavobacterium sp.]